MKKNLFYFLLMGNVVLLTAQQYRPFPDSNAVWRVNWSTSGCLSSNIPESRYQYFISGDTNINSQSYKKLYRDGVCNTLCCNPPYLPKNGYVGAFRQTIINKKVFILLAEDTVESLLYDFNLSVGDTIKGLLAYSPDLTVNSIDSIQIGLFYNKKFNFNYIDGQNSIIEGIGSAQGLLEPIKTFDAAGSLICFKKNDSILYFNEQTFDSCNINTNLEEIESEETNFEIFPNPVAENITIEYSQKAIIEISNIQGKAVKTLTANGNRTNVDVSTFLSGVYIVKVITYNGIAVKKFVKE